MPHETKHAISACSCRLRDLASVTGILPGPRGMSDGYTLAGYVYCQPWTASNIDSAAVVELIEAKRKASDCWFTIQLIPLLSHSSRMRLKEAYVNPNMARKSALGVATERTRTCLSRVHLLCFNVAMALIVVTLLTRSGQDAVYNRHSRIIPAIWLNHIRGNLHPSTPITPAWG